MKALSIIALFGTCSLMFMGCPYESKIPLDTADKGKLDKSLVGKWEEKGSDSYTWTCSVDGNQYRIEKQSNEDKDDDPTVYIGFLTDVAGSPFLNVYEQDYSTDKKYMIYRMDKKGDDRVKFRAMTDNVTEEFTTSEDFKSFVKKNMEMSFFYNKDDEKTFYKED